MSFQAMAWATEHRLPAMQKIVLLMLANRTNPDNGLCFPSHDRLAEDCGMTKRSVIQQIEKLEQSGLINVIRETRDGVRRVNKYKLNLSKISGCSEPHSPSSSEPRSLGGSECDSHKTVTLETENKTFFSFLSEDEKLCFEWASNEPFWVGKIKGDLKNFRKYYNNGQLKAQYESYQAQKNLCATANGHTGLNGSINQPNGGKYGTQNWNGQGFGFGGKLSAVDQVKLACNIGKHEKPTERCINE
ncbi:hypothetical protein CRENPOLYSF2_3280003 [Crenothrix polyspora]|uniref:Helix-turn-helix domain-containing protein n=1 Tax=Crenothrix polyspora TaxID=360316 RepID=A0A1R4HAU0_9GAMM|nr:helix-turn-helix domain-containing protein [Crenothrix polyspora]SJM93382.1 hypothetical protein CRENPOLYSF2_3280003 [Crenothrix polyspora]